MSNLAQFAFGNNQVRVVLIDGQPWFVAADLAKILEYANTGKMLQIVDKEDSVEINPQKLDNTKMVLSFNSNTFRVSLTELAKVPTLSIAGWGWIASTFAKFML